MQPIQESPDMPIQGKFKGDQIYVILDVLLFLAGYIVTFVMMGAITDEAFKNSQSQGQKVPIETIQAITMGFIGCTAVVCAPINIVFWINMLKGKKWAFISMLVLIIIGVLMSATRLSGPLMGWTVFTLAFGLGKAIYCGMRVAGKVGPALS